MATRSEEIEREIEDTRRDMSRTAAEIERRLRAENIMDNAMSWLRTSPRGRALTEDVTDVVSRNPMPVVLIGIGVLWLAWEMSRSRSPQRLNRYTPMRRRMGPDYPASRHHTHVEDEGSAAYPGRAPDPDDLLGRVPGTHSAREAAEAFREAGRAGDQGGDRGEAGDRFSGGTAGGPASASNATGLGDYVDRGGDDRGGRADADERPDRVAVYDTDTGAKLEERGPEDEPRVGGRRA